jgi:RNA polymerase sigma-B factor
MRRYRSGDQRARDVLIERYLPLARRLARRYGSSREPMDDLVQVASLGLLKAVDRWDPSRGLAFSSYAVPTILGELRRYFRDSTWTVRPPRELSELSASLDRSRDRLSAALSREPTAADLAQHHDKPLETVVEALRAGQCRWMGALEGETLEDPSGSDFVDQVEARVTVERLVSNLDRRAREVLRLRFHDDLLQSQIADRLGCSQIHVSRLIRSSLDKLSLCAAA